MKYGFTLLELILVMGIVSLLFVLGSLSYFSSYKSTNIETAKSVLLADLRTQQSLAMSGGESSGIKIDSDHYILLPGNIVIMAKDGITFNSSFSGSGEIIFARGSGIISNFTSGQDTITLTSLGTTQVIRLNQYGIVIGD